MNCKQVEDLLPLYAGHDLEVERARLIAAHLQICTACASSAVEYDQANQLLQQFEPPQFSDAAYAAIRHNVLHEIERGSGALTLRELLLSPFQPRVRWAVSTAVLLVVCAFAYYFIANRTTGPQNNREATALPGSADGSPASATASPSSPLRQTAQNDLVAPSPAGVPGSPTLGTSPRKQRLNLTASAQRHLTKAGGIRAVHAIATQYLPNIESVDLTPNTSATSGKTLRLEIQTQDPNIRIIWFSQPSTNEASPNEASKGI